MPAKPPLAARLPTGWDTAISIPAHFIAGLPMKSKARVSTPKARQKWPTCAAGFSLVSKQRQKGCDFIPVKRTSPIRIRTPEISMLASSVSAIAVVREYLLDVQRDIGRRKEAVFEGRDMGTVVFPAADVKFFLNASLTTRALRRYEELKPKSDQSLDTVEKDMQRRDTNDSTRSLAPLKPADDAIVIDSTDLSVQEVVDRMLLRISEKG